MTKSEILVVVKRMQKDWQSAIDGNREAKNNCLNGFCYWSFYTGRLSVMEDFYLMRELRKELIDKHISNNIYWYPTYNNCRTRALLPRLEHLNRTITRLENELKTEQND